jgi:aminopeptidase N
VGWKNYHEQWLSEGFAQYFAALYAGADRGPDTLDALVADMRDSTIPRLSQGPISLGYRLGHIQSDGRVFRSIIYNKSAVVLHMLRRLIGDEAFFAGVRKFYKDWRFQKAGTDDLRAVFESTSSMPLGRFFDRWIGGSSIPKIRLTSRVAEGGESALVKIEQVGDVFDLPLTVSVQYADGRNEEVTIKVREATVEQAVALKGPVRRIVVKDELSLYELVR